MRVPFGVILAAALADTGGKDFQVAMQNLIEAVRIQLMAQAAEQEQVKLFNDAPRRNPHR